MLVNKSKVLINVYKSR